MGALGFPTDEVDPRFKENWGPCACGCGEHGTLKKNGHVRRACTCKKCMAPRYKQRGSADERRIAKDLGGERQPLSGALNGADVLYPGGAVEVTREKRIAGPVRTAWNNKTVRLLQRRNAYADRAVLVLTEQKPWLAVMLYEDWRREP